MHTIEPTVNRPDRNLVSDFEGIPSTIISDVIENVGMVMDSGIKPISRGEAVTGTALTVKGVPGDNLIIHKAITMAEPGDILIIDGDGYTETAYLGELMCTSCQAHDLAGIVIDGAIRDREEIAKMGFPLYARGVHPRGPVKQHPGSINVPISCGGVTVRPGDIVVGDDDGVAVVPADDAETIYESAREKLAAEDDLRERVEDGEYLYEISGYDEVFENLDVAESGESIQ